MGSKYPILTPKEIIIVLNEFGFNKVSRIGSHVKYKNDSIPQRTVIIPMHSEIAKGTLKSILEQANIDLDDFLSHL